MFGVTKRRLLRNSENLVSYSLHSVCPQHSRSNASETAKFSSRGSAPHPAARRGGFLGLCPRPLKKSFSRNTMGPRPCTEPICIRRVDYMKRIIFLKFASRSARLALLARFAQITGFKMCCKHYERHQCALLAIHGSWATAPETRGQRKAVTRHYLDTFVTWEVGHTRSSQREAHVPFLVGTIVRCWMLGSEGPLFINERHHMPMSARTNSSGVPGPWCCSQLVLCESSCSLSQR